ncbi:mechanosensitive ion channel domain-containing protein [Synechococcus sp. CCY 9618]|uniref:mechanosensitive ion channel domain-containing protein n=1 Tax=Synechococcus sp. CCY 9618 TaxID=2815602 RepID=UPI001C2166B3|nr:mechanosensitive ion channel domain-containing protein [Synechococcus sp. CCY 9618]
MEDVFRQLGHWFAEPYVRKFTIAIVGVFFISVVSQLFQRSLPSYIVGSDNRYYARKIVSFLGYFGAAFLIASVFRDSLGGLSVAIGVASAGIAFSLQEVIASVAGWIAISFGGFYATGDRVQLGGIRGDIIDIGILRTTLMELGEWVQSDLYTGRIVRIANSFVFKAPVFNYSGDFPFLWDEIKVPVKYGSDHQLARQILERVVLEVVSEEVTQKVIKAWRSMVSKYLVENARVEPMVTMALTDNWMEFTVRYVVDYKIRRLTKDLLFSRILDEFLTAERRVEIGSTTVHLVETPEFRVRMTGPRD